MKKTILLCGLLLAFVLFSCSSDDDGGTTQQFVAAFENPSMSFTADDASKEVKLVFSKTAPEDGTVTITYTTVNAEYGTHFTTDPSGEEGTIEVPITAGSNQSTFTFNKLANPIEGTEMSVSFKLEAITNPNSAIQGNTTLAVSFTESAAVGGVMAPEVGGPDQPNQVYVDLSAQTQTVVKRDAWDLGFYSGESFRVVLNESVYMAAAPLEVTDIDAVTEADVAALQPNVAVGIPGSNVYVDNPSGDIQETVIAEVSETDTDNKVYLVNLGINIGGSIHVPGGSRGWKKIRVLRQGNDYVLQYADLNATTHEEVVVSKAEGYNFTFFSFSSGEQASVEPMKNKWDLNFTHYIDLLSFQGDDYAYTYQDFIVSNTKAGITAYQVAVSDFTYEDFTSENIVEANLSADQRSIGSSWRNAGGPNAQPSIKEDVFYVLKDADGNYYKIRFTAMYNESGERGYPKFEYSLL
ncbi:HmuY family protein [Galbibacter pacificus]|uniref:HmuY family protein n=1 Tax=Galbibacter pacificus TaxID=2996052 RepID=A0ABT6FMD9_9FLAO|nr:HmuY family protein [Galbibacter pacificus]MDG3580937.1 HmuY family protein [Galbibacter pacificus]MDG3584415.1 HmuY family protein [Galbibacter pacificus]